MNGKEMALRENTTLAERWENNLKVAEQMIKTGLLPKHITSPAQAVLIIEQGRELGLPPLQALRKIYVVNGTPGLMGEVMLALIYQSGLAANVIIKGDMKGCTTTMQRKGMTPQSIYFGKEDAERLGLMYRDQYKKQPDVMYRWRSVAACARLVFSDVIGGMYLPEELENISEVVQDKTQIEYTESIAEQGYDVFKDELFARLESDMEGFTEPYSVEKWRKGNEKEISMLMDEDRQKITATLEAKHSELVTGNKTDTIDELARFYELAESKKTVTELREWFKTIQSQAQKTLTSDQFTQLIQHCTDLKENLDKAEQVKDNPEILNKNGIQWNFLMGECSKIESKIGVKRYKEELGKFGFEKEADMKLEQLKKFVKQLETAVKQLEEK